MLYVADTLLFIRKKSNKSNVCTVKHKKTFNCFEISHINEVKIRHTCHWGWKSDTFFRFVKVDVLLPIDQIQNNTSTSQILSKLYQNGVEGIKVLDANFARQRTSPDLNLTIYDDTKFSSSHKPYTNTILHHVSSYDFQSYKLFQAGNFNVNIL